MLYSLGWTPSLLHTVWSFHTGCWMSQRSISEHYFLPAKKKKERISEELLNRFIIKLNKNHKSTQWTVICIWYIYIFNEKIIKRYTYHHKWFFFTVFRRGTKIFFFYLITNFYIWFAVILIFLWTLKFYPFSLLII